MLALQLSENVIYIYSENCVRSNEREAVRRFLTGQGIALQPSVQKLTADLGSDERISISCPLLLPIHPLLTRYSQERAVCGIRCVA